MEYPLHIGHWGYSIWNQYVTGDIGDIPYYTGDAHPQISPALPKTLLQSRQVPAALCCWRDLSQKVDADK
jgi:hypothetical protein